MTSKEIYKAYSYYLCGASLAKTAREFNTDRRVLFDRFKRLNLKMRSKVMKPSVEFNGSKYTQDKNGYYRKTVGNRSHLHRDIWIANNGTIEKEECLVFIDGNKSNYKYENLRKMLVVDFVKTQTKNNQYTKGK